MGWEPGSTVLNRSVKDGVIFGALTVRVVQDDKDLVALYVCPGSPGTRRKGQRGGPRASAILPGGWHGEYEDYIWHTNRALFLCRPGDAYSVAPFWRASDGEFLCWHINLQAPVRRSRFGFDTLDHVLDVVVAPDLRSWAWKDEDEFAWCQEVGLLTHEEAIAIRAEGERAIEALNRRESPYRDGWEHWSPDPKWGPITELPEGWDRVE